jgi:UTP-glucose-1-phosphate uridylyltransferase/mevalonate kinase
MATKSADTEVFVPGRICLFGEHSDWAGSFTRFNADITPGMTIVCGTNQGLYARIKRHPSSLIVTTTTDKGETVGPVEIPMDVNILLKTAQEGGFWSYAAGVAYKIATDYRVSGLEIHNYKTDLPLRKGLSSSAAFCVLVARAFNIMYDIKMTIRGEMEYAYQGELATPSRCGRMDQGCAYGPRPILMTYDGEFVGVDPINLNGPPLHYVVVDLAGDKSTTEILAGLQAGYPFPRDDVAKGVHNLLGPLNKDISTRSLKALEAGDGEELGKLMKEGQDAWDTLGMPACPTQLTAPLLHKVLAHPALQEHIWGGKGVGSQGDGTCQLLAKSEEQQTLVMEIIERDFKMETLSLTLAPGAGVRKAVIPAAGFTTAMYPASKTVKTELFPVLDKDGYTKPAIMIHVEELVSAGIEQVIIIVMPDDLTYFERLFHQPDTLENFNKLPAHFQRYAKQILAIGEKVKFVVQEKQEGFGHALLCAKELVDNEPFLLLIGHHIYRSSPSSPSVAAQMLKAYAKHKSSIVGLKQTPLNEVSRYGTVGGVWLRDKDGDEVEEEITMSNLVAQVLSDIGMSQYYERFAEEKLLYSQLSELTSEELKEMSIPLGHRKRMLVHFRWGLLCGTSCVVYLLCGASCVSSVHLFCVTY